MTTRSQAARPPAAFSRPALTQRADLLHDQEAQLVRAGGQPCESIVLQRFLLVILRGLVNHDLKGGAVATSRLFCRSQDNVHLGL